MANEGSCHNSILGGTFENCSIKCIVSGNFTEFIKTIDSIFIFNNVFQNVGAAMDLWEGSTQIIGVNCIKNVFFYNNTSIGFVGTTSSQQSVINTQFPYYNPVLNTYSSLSNIQIYNNIFCIDKQNYPNLRGYLSLFAPLHPSANVIDLKGNLWNYAFSNKVAADTVNTGLPGNINLVVNGNYNELVPGPPNINFKLIGKPYSNTPQADYYGKARKSQTNVGAFEFDPSLEIKKSGAIKYLRIQPNPTGDVFTAGNYTGTLFLLDLRGQKITELNPSGGIYTLPGNVRSGVYYLREVKGNTAGAVLQVIKP